MNCKVLNAIKQLPLRTKCRSVTLLLSLGAGAAVSIKAGKYIFKDSAGNVLLEAGEQEVKALKGADRVESFADMMSPEDAKIYNQWMSLREAGIDQSVVNDIILTNIGYRANPEIYLPKEYIEMHLSKFDEGISVIQTDYAYSRYSEIMVLLVFQMTILCLLCLKIYVMRLWKELKAMFP